MAKKKVKKKAKRRTKRLTAKKKLTERQLRFIEHYVINQNAKQAALKAGYAKSGAEQEGHRLLHRHPLVGPEIERRLAKKAEDHDLDADRVMLENKRLGFSDIRKLFHEDGRQKTPHELDDDTAAALSSIKVTTRTAGVDADGNTILERTYEYKFWDKNSAQERLGRNKGLFPTRIEQTGKDGAPLDREINIIVISGKESAATKRVIDARFKRLGQDDSG